MLSLVKERSRNSGWIQSHNDDTPKEEFERWQRWKKEGSPFIINDDDGIFIPARFPTLKLC